MLGKILVDGLAVDCNFKKLVNFAVSLRPEAVVLKQGCAIVLFRVSVSRLSTVNCSS